MPRKNKNVKKRLGRPLISNQFLERVAFRLEPKAIARICREFGTISKGIRSIISDYYNKKDGE